MAKREVTEAEKKALTLEAQEKHVREQISDAQDRLRSATLSRDKAEANLLHLKGRAGALRSMCDSERANHAVSLREQDELTSQLEDVEQLLALEKAQLYKSESIYLGINEVKRALVDVHRELRELSSPDVREAAIRAAGNDLPVELVPPTQLPECALTASGVKVEDFVKDPADPNVRTELHQAAQLQSVLVAIFQSLSMRTTELREGLKQLGFTRNMGKETDDLIQQVAIGHSETKKEMKDMQEETDKYRAELKCDSESIEMLKREMSDMRENRETILSDLHELSQIVTNLQAEFSSTTAALYRLTHSHERMVLEHSEIGRQLESQRQDVTVHEEQTLQRTQAAKRLAERAFEQVRKSTVELEKSMQEFASFQDAHQKLLASHDALEIELRDAHAAYIVLRDEHDMLNLQLTSLAHHYTQALETFTVPPTTG